MAPLGVIESSLGNGWIDEMWVSWIPTAKAVAYAAHAWGMGCFTFL
ncbi:hypothetical protein FWH09_00520 [Candidatus Saccharibacteria bacterium]|nr:hypothetical protein [Candidatus Saccharibacteria bacterium]